MAGEILDLASEPHGSATPKPERKALPFVGIHFQCCDIYSRIHMNRDSTAFVGNCPRCARPVQILVSADGTDARFFSAK